jgi:hypothetical protein
MINTINRPKGLRFFDELNDESQEFAVSEAQNGGERFDWDDAKFLTEDFKEQLATRGFDGVEAYWSLGYCQGRRRGFLRVRVGAGIEGIRRAGENFNRKIGTRRRRHRHRNHRRERALPSLEFDDRRNRIRQRA